MAQLRLERSGKSVVPPGECLIGRSAACAVRIKESDVSSEHAVLRWLGTAWELRDLGSRNGTFVEDRRLAAGERVLLDRGARLRFGVKGEAWILDDVGAPAPQAVDMDSGDVVTGNDGLLGLPSDGDWEVVISQAGLGAWQFESGGESRTVRDGEIIEVAGRRWRLSLPRPPDITTQFSTDHIGLDSARLCFRVSGDPKHVLLQLCTPTKTVDLDDREGALLLLMLAQRRLKDAAANPGDPAACGWLRVDILCRSLNIERNRFTAIVHHCRQYLVAAGVAGAVGIVERRPETGCVRIGSANLEIAEYPGTPGHLTLIT